MSQSPFVKKKEDVKPNDQPLAQINDEKPKVDSDGKPIEVEEDDNGAIQHLIYHSFYPLTCMVPLGDDFITIKEKVPDFMQAKSNDTLLQETIKTFHGLMQEKDDEILNLRRQLKDDDSSIVKMISEMIQTDLTLEACEDMERRLDELSESLPDKVEMIHQLGLEKTKLQKSIEDMGAGDDKSRINQLEDELSESLKNLVELEENNLSLSKENKDLKQGYLELKWQLEEINDLKVEVELAKIQTEEEMNKIKDSVQDKDILIEKLRAQLGGDIKEGFETPLNDYKGSKPVSLKEFETMCENYQKKIFDLENQLRDKIGRENEPTNDLSELIEKVKTNILDTSCSSKITESVGSILPKYAEKFRSSDINAIEELVVISSESNTSKEDLQTIYNILDSIRFNGQGETDQASFIECYNRNIGDKNRSSELNRASMEELRQRAMCLGLTLKINTSLVMLTVEDLRKEYLKLELILNILNKSFKMTQIVNLNKLLREELISKVLRMKGKIFQICMHTFWQQVFHQPIAETDNVEVLTMDSNDFTVFSDLLFPNFMDHQSFQTCLVSIKRLREILLVGEETKNNVVANVLPLMKIQGLSICHDVANHLLPIFPKEFRYLIMGRSVEDSINSENNLVKNVSADFLSAFPDSFGNHSDLPDGLFLILLALDFENDLFSVSSKSPTSEYKVGKLSISNVSNKVESTTIKVGVNKNIKQFLQKKLIELENIFANFTEKPKSDSSKRKTESDFIKDLIGKKENLLRFIFNDAFRPVAEKLSVAKGSAFLSCVSKEMVSLDFWVKFLLDKYRSKQLIQFKEFSTEDIEVCITRLSTALKMLCPAFVDPELDPKKTRITLILTLVKYRKLLRGYIDHFLYGKTEALKFVNNIHGVVTPEEIRKLSTDKPFENLRNMFQNDENNKGKLEDVLQRLYDIDCEIYPGVFNENIDKKAFSSISDGELFEEIIKLRLSIAAYVITPPEWISIKEKTVSDFSGQFKSVKDIQAIILKLEPGVIDERIVASESKVVKQVIEKLKKSVTIDNEKLKACLMALKKIESDVIHEDFDQAKHIAEFDKRSDGEERKKFVLREAENLLSIMSGTNCDPNNSGKISDGYRKVEELLQDIEGNISANDEHIQQTWTYCVWEKTDDIVKLISGKSIAKRKLEPTLRDKVVNNLEDIQSWVLSSSDWRRVCFNRMNNLVRKVNSGIKNRKILPSTCDNLEMSDDFQDEKVAFEKAFSQLEDRFNELVSVNDAGPEKADEFDLGRNSNEQLKSIILALEKEIGRGSWSESEESEAREWLESRSRDQLLDDCNNLIHKSLLVKIENMLNRSVTEKETLGDRMVKSSQVAQFQEDINAKLAKYEELCETVERLKIPQLQAPRQSGSNHQLPISGTYTRQRNNIIPAFDQQLSSRPSYSPSLRASTNQVYQPQNNDDDIDLYIQQRLDDLQKLIKSPKKEWMARRSPQTVSDVVVDGFEIEDERTPRYYSMKLQDIQHERKEDEMGALIHHIEQNRSDLLTDNKNLQEQLYVSRQFQDNQTQRLMTLEKTEEVLRRQLATTETGGQSTFNSEEIQLMRLEKQRLVASNTSAQRKMDQLNSELVSVTSSNTNLQHENHNLIIKNQYLERSIKKIEELCEDLVQQLAYCKSQPERHTQENNVQVNDSRQSPISDSDIDRKLRLAEKEKVELVKKLDIIDQQNKLLRRHCEKLNTEVSDLTRKLAEAQDNSDTYFKQNQQLTEVLDKMNAGKGKFDSSSSTNSMRHKDEEIKQLRNKIHHLETRLLSANESPSGERLKQELITNKDREIARLADQVGSLQDCIDETRAQLEVKDYENRKLQSLTKQLQNRASDDAYFPPPGYKLVKDK